jgi:hypothetical protein
VQGLNIVDERAKLGQMRSKIDADYSSNQKGVLSKTGRHFVPRKSAASQIQTRTMNTSA